MPELTTEQLDDLKTAITDSDNSLEYCVGEIYKRREPRDLLGDEGILVRTVGPNFIGPPHQFTPTYFDQRRGRRVQTEFAECLDALTGYDSGSQDIDDQVDLLLEVGDMYYQLAVVNVRHSENPDAPEVRGKIETALQHLCMELQQRDLRPEKAEELSAVKYRIRVWLAEQGYKPTKDKELEATLCAEQLEAA